MCEVFREMLELEEIMELFKKIDSGKYDEIIAECVRMVKRDDREDKRYNS